MRKATYQDLQHLKSKLAEAVSAFRAEFGEIPVEIQVKTELTTNHGIETIGFKLKEVPAQAQGELPFEMYPEERHVPQRPFARVFAGGDE